jgi:hypothetical protein
MAASSTGSILEQKKTASSRPRPAAPQRVIGGWLLACGIRAQRRGLIGEHASHVNMVLDFAIQRLEWENIDSKTPVNGLL